MISKEDFLLLSELENSIADQYGNKIVDIRPTAKQIGLDMDNVMRRIIEICRAKDYTVGYHMDCTRHNVIPEYERSW